MLYIFRLFGKLYVQSAEGMALAASRPCKSPDTSLSSQCNPLVEIHILYGME